MTFDSKDWTGRRPYDWAKKSYLFFKCRWFFLSIGYIHYIGDFGIEFSGVPVEKPKPYERIYKFNYTKSLVSGRSIMNAS